VNLGEYKGFILTILFIYLNKYKNNLTNNIPKAITKTMKGEKS